MLDKTILYPCPVFSKVKTNKIREIFHGYASYNANAIMGETYHGKQKDGSLIGGYKFQNLFGYVEQVDASTGETAKSTQLYELPTHTIYTETNCIGCESLPANHGFDASGLGFNRLVKPKSKRKGKKVRFSYVILIYENRFVISGRNSCE